MNSSVLNIDITKLELKLGPQVLSQLDLPSCPTTGTSYEGEFSVTMVRIVLFHAQKFMGYTKKEYVAFGKDIR